MRVLLLARSTVAEETTELTLQFLDQETFSYSAGQYIDLSLPSLTYPDERGNSRSLSIVSAPHETGTISVVFRNSESGWKRTALAIPLGTHLELAGPAGFFTLPRKTTRPIIAIAGGVGIAPFISMTRHAKFSSSGHAISLLYENKKIERAPYITELRETVPTFYEQYGHTPKERLAEIVQSHQNPLFYVAGPIGMVARIHGNLLSLGVDDLSILTEEFTGY